MSSGAIAGAAAAVIHSRNITNEPVSYSTISFPPLIETLILLFSIGILMLLYFYLRGRKKK